MQIIKTEIYFSREIKTIPHARIAKQSVSSKRNCDESELLHHPSIAAPALHQTVLHSAATVMLKHFIEIYMYLIIYIYCMFKCI